MDAEQLFVMIADFVEKSGGKYVFIGSLTEMDHDRDQPMVDSYTLAVGAEDARVYAIQIVTMAASINDRFTEEVTPLRLNQE